MARNKFINIALPVLAGFVLTVALLALTGLVQADDDSYSVVENTVLAVPAPGVLGNDAGATTATLVTDVANGTLLLNADGSFLYTPTLDYNGPDQFVYSTITVTQQYTAFIDVLPNDPPVAVDDDYLAKENFTLTVNAPGVLSNDSDVDGDPLTATINSLPTHGTLSLQPNGRFTYTPTANYYGPDQFSYEVTDGYATSNIATVDLTVNDVPGVFDDASATAEDTPQPVNVLFNDADFVGGLDNSTLAVVADGFLGTSTITAEPTPRILYTPDPNAFGQDIVEYEVCDTFGECQSAFVTIDITPVNDRPVPVNDAYTYNADYLDGSGVYGPMLIGAPGVLANDTDIDSPLTDLSVIDVSAQPANGSVQANADGSFSYTPDQDFNGSDFFEYRVSDGLLNAVGRVDLRVDTERPQVSWTSPQLIVNGSNYFYYVFNPLGAQVTVAFDAVETVGAIDTVVLRRWDRTLLQWQDLQTFTATPYSLTFHTNELGQLGFNELRAYVYDDAGNLGTINMFIFVLYNSDFNYIYLPNAFKP